MFPVLPFMGCLVKPGPYKALLLRAFPPWKRQRKWWMRALISSLQDWEGLTSCQQLGAYQTSLSSHDGWPLLDRSMR